MNLLTRRGLCSAFVLLGLVATAIVFSFSGNADYSKDGGPSIEALLGGDWAGFVDNPPLMGSFSIFLRLPFAALAEPLDPTKANLEFQLGALACLLVTTLTGLLVARAMARRGASSIAQLVVATLFVVNPLTFSALAYGHPEEALGGALCVLAVLAALESRPMLAGLFLGLALGTKQWALVAILPVLVAMPRNWIKGAITAAVVAAVLWLPFVAGNFNSFTGQTKSVTDIRGGMSTPPNIWAPFADERLVDLRDLDRNSFAPEPVTIHFMPAIAGWVNRPLIVLLPIPLSLLFLWVRRRPGKTKEASRKEDVFALLALVLLLRCLLDPFNNGYYHAPFLMSLLAYQGLRRDGFPLLSVCTVAAMSISDYVTRQGSFELASFFYLGWALPLTGCLVLFTYFPSQVGAIRRKVRAWLPQKQTVSRSAHAAR